MIKEYSHLSENILMKKTLMLLAKDLMKDMNLNLVKLEKFHLHRLEQKYFSKNNK